MDAITYNDTVEYYGANKTVRYGFVNKNLQISGDGAVTSNTDLSVTNSLVIDPDGTLNMNGNVLTVNGELLIADLLYRQILPVQCHSTAKVPEI